MGTQKLWLYESSGCPYCMRVRRFLADIGETVELRDTMSNHDYLLEVIAATGRRTVPCLKIEESAGNFRWIHESSDIIDFLGSHFKA
jgi:glutaredoxin